MSLATLNVKQLDAAVRVAQRDCCERWLQPDGAAHRGHGALVLRVTRAGAAHWYYRYTLCGQRRHLPLGSYPALSLAAAREQAHAHAGAQLKMRPTGEDLVAQQRALRSRQRQQLQRKDALRAPDVRFLESPSSHSLAALCALYVEHLQRQRKSSAADVRRLLARHIPPAVAAMPAAALSRRDVMALLRPLSHAGKERTAGKLRSYLRAAYELALQAEGHAQAPAALLEFPVTQNPVIGTRPIAVRAGQRVLLAEELLDYWQAVQASDAPLVRVLRVQLLLAGQRVQQLLRVRLEDVDLQRGTLRLQDPKGKRRAPREHLLPLTPLLQRELQDLVNAARARNGTHLFCSQGTTPIRPETLSKQVRRWSTTWMEQHPARSSFMLCDIRRTCETELAALGVSKDIRAQLLSHGLGGVQDRHYDRYGYLREKYAALELWEQHLLGLAHRVASPQGAVYRFEELRRAA